MLIKENSLLTVTEKDVQRDVDNKSFYSLRSRVHQSLITQLYSGFTGEEEAFAKMTLY